jgi:phosphoserine phosphatase RsbU/P
MPEEEQKTVLVIDDDLVIRKLISHHLKKNNYNVHEAVSAASGFDFLNQDKIDLVLCDVTMDDMDGFSFCRKVRENENHRFLPFVFVTAKTSMEDKTTALEAGGDDLITKPFNVDELLIKVQTLIRRTEIYKVYGAKKQLEKSFTKSTSKIVLIDDEKTLAKLFQYNLNKEGFDCRVAYSAAEGLQLIKQDPPDIIISDIMMPEIDGYKFRKMLLADEELKRIPFVFLTAKGEESDILSGYDLGIADYVIKTAGPRVITAKIHAIINSLGKERDKVVSELNRAADSLRAKVVPDSTPNLEGFKITQWHSPFQGIPGGDFLDYFILDENKTAVVLGDVMGKKWGAWYFAFAYAGYVRSAVRMVLQSGREYTPSEILQQVNQSLYSDAKVSEVFATLSVIVLDNSSKTVKYTGAGDLPILFKENSSNKIMNIQSKGLLLGFSEKGNYSDVSIDMEKGDCLLMLTDGVIESRNKNNEQFGEKRVIEVLNDLKENEDALEKIKEKVVDFTSGNFEDDISLIFIRRL